MKSPISCVQFVVVKNTFLPKGEVNLVVFLGLEHHISQYIDIYITILVVYIMDRT